MPATDRSDAYRARLRIVVLGVTAAAVAFGVWARFKGIAKWPLAVDEYYTINSVENVLAFGLPAYECGGYYTRGLLFQYIAAFFQLCGASAELSGRLISAVSSLIALPAAYLLGVRLHGRTVGALAVALLAVSVWEVEMARFARMYAPFQAVFLWYLLFFIRYTVDRERAALWPMLLLTVLGVLTWEGGIFLAVLNLMPPLLNNPSGRLTRRDWSYLLGTGLLLVPIAWFVTADLRWTGAGTELPLGFESHVDEETRRATIDSISPWATITRHPLWLAAGIVPLAFAFASLRWLWMLRDRWLVATGLALALLAALLHQFAAFVLILMLLLTTGLMQWRELVSRPAGRYLAAAFAAMIFWMAYGLATDDWLADATSEDLGGHRALLLVYELVRFPDFGQEILRPWVGAIPLLALWLGACLAVATLHVIRNSSSDAHVERVLLVILIVLLAAASASGPPRHETRYVFFLYPVALLIAITVVVRATETLRAGRAAAAAFGAIAVVALFAITEDFNPRHLAQVDSARVNFRMDLRGREVAHLLTRVDVRGAAQWLQRNAADSDLVINAFPSVDHYYRNFDFTFIDSRSQRFEAYACRRGTRERWGNLPLLHSESALESRIAAADRTVLVVSSRQRPAFMRDLARWHPRIAWTSLDGGLDILEFRSAEVRSNREAAILSSIKAD